MPPDTTPKLARLIEALHRLGGDPAVAEKHASIIFARLIAVVAPARGFDIGGNDEAGFYAHARTQTTGLERELRDLGGKARKAACGKLGLTAWMAAWAVLPQRTMRPLVATEGDADGARPHDRPQHNRGVIFLLRGFTRSRLSRKWSCQPSKPRSSGSRQHPARGGDSARSMPIRLGPGSVSSAVACRAPTTTSDSARSTRSRVCRWRRWQPIIARCCCGAPDRTSRSAATSRSSKLGGSSPRAVAFVWIKEKQERRQGPHSRSGMLDNR